MRATTRKILKNAAKRLGLGVVLRRINSLLQEPALMDSLPTGTPDEIFGYFTDSFGNEIALLSGLRDRLKPNWRTMFSPQDESDITPPETCLAEIDAWRRRLDPVEDFLGLYGLSVARQDVVEIGAFRGATAYALAQAGAKRVLATDLAAYYLTQSPDPIPTQEAVAAKNLELARHREARAARISEQISQRVSFLEDDICASSLGSASVDAVLSWEVLEHLMNPEDALLEIARVLRPGGFAFHEYNPFFSLDGGHSLCTLDFPWGHARLQAEDFERYLAELRPAEMEMALSFYRTNLNRMTFSDLKRGQEKSGMRLLALIPWYSRQHMAYLTPVALEQCRRVYPATELTDLISPVVWVLMKKDG